MRAHYIRTMLEKAIAFVASHIQDYAVNPRDLTRRRKLPPAMLLPYFITAGCGTAVTELQKLYSQLGQTPVGSALSMQRAKLKPAAGQEMYRLFNLALERQGGRPPKWQFIAVDGTHFTCPDRNRSKREYKDWRHKSGGKHLEGNVIAAYDTRAMRMLDAEIQPLRKMNESRAMCRIIDRFNPRHGTNVCFTGDRAYPS